MFDSMTSLFNVPETIKELIVLSNHMKSKAYSPYSNFNVGAALLCEDGTIISGIHDATRVHVTASINSYTSIYTGKKYFSIKGLMPHIGDIMRFVRYAYTTS